MSQHTTNQDRQQHWQKHIDDWQSSGLSRARYCRDHELSYHVFNYWHAKLNSSSTPSKLVPVLASLPVPTHLPSQGLELQLPNGVHIRGVDSASVDLVGRLIAQL